MKLLLSFLALIFLSLSVAAQSSQKLVSDNGYKQFKMGSSASTYKDIQHIEDSEDADEQYYYYTGNDRVHFGYHVYKMELNFSQDHLYDFRFEYSPSSIEQYKHILANMEKVYGKSKELVIKLEEKEARYWNSGDYSVFIKFYEVGDAGIVSVGFVNLNPPGLD